MDPKLRMSQEEMQEIHKLMMLGYIKRCMAFRSWEVTSLNIGPHPGHWSHLRAPLIFFNI